MDKNAVLRHYPYLDPPAGQEIMQLPVAIPVEQSLNLGRGLVPTFLERCLADMLRHDHIGRVKLAVTDNLYCGDRGDLFAYQLEDRAAEIAGDTLIGLCPPKPVSEKGMVEPLAAR